MTGFHELARISAERVLNGVLEGMVIGLIAAVMLRIVDRRNAASRNSTTRFAILLAALFSIAALPVWNIARAGAGTAASAGAVWAVTVPVLWASYVLTAWAGIAMIGLARVGLGLWQLRKLRAGSEILDARSLDPVLQHTLGEFAQARKVMIAVSEKVAVPAAIGFLSPMVVLPKWTLRELSAAELNSILIHELAHLQRRDDWTNLAQKVLGALLFFHPAVWWVERQLSLEREMACDDVVLAHTSNPRAYAECLVTVAERSFMRRSVALAQAAVSKMRQTTLRVSQILDGKAAAATRVWKPALGIVALASGIFVVGLAQAPELVAFRESAPVVASLVAPATIPLVPAGMAKDSAVAAKAVPVSFTVKPQSPRRNAAVKMARTRVENPQSGMEILAKAITPVVLPAPNGAQTVLVVMRSEQFGASGQNWTVCVWQFTVLRPEQIPAGLKIPAKSI